MNNKKPRNHSAEFKAKVALETVRGDLTINEISKKYGVHSTQINRWKHQALGSLRQSFTGKQQKVEIDNQKLMDDLYRQIGQLTYSGPHCLDQKHQEKRGIISRVCNINCVN